MEEKDFKEVKHALETNKTGLDHIDEHIYVKMFGYKSVLDYYYFVSLDNYVKNFAVPTICLGAKDDPLCGH